MRNLLLATAALAALTSADAAANVIYSFESSNGPGLRLELTEALTSFNLFGGPANGPIPGSGAPYAGDVARFVSFAVEGDQTYTPTGRFGTIALSLAFNNGGNVTSTSLTTRGLTIDTNLAGGPGPQASGTFFRDFTPCPEQGCAYSGQWRREGPAQPVPEPMSLALFGVGLAGLAAVRRRAA